MIRSLLLAVLLVIGATVSFLAGAPVSLDEGWRSPPKDARLRAYWWWLNGNVTKQAITRDLEEMKAKGFGGALICDAGGAEQDGNNRVPHGPTFFTPEWRELYKHCLYEANRLDLEMSLNILSGWNLGGPMVEARDAAKKLVWSETVIKGPARVEQTLPLPGIRDNFYQDLFVVAYRLEEELQRQSRFSGVTASSQQPGQGAALAVDGASESFWVSDSVEAGQGPSVERPQWLQLNFTEPVSINRLIIEGRTGYGPRECELLASDDGCTFRRVKTFVAGEKGSTEVSIPGATAKHFRVSIFSAYDPRFPTAPRNVQVAEIRLAGTNAVWPEQRRVRPIQNLQQKAMHRSLHFSAPDTAPLFEELPCEPGEEETVSAEVLDLSSRLRQGGVLEWEVPEGAWQVLRFGCTIGDHSRVSTSSEGWTGYALDVLDAGAFERYWDVVVDPLIDDAGDLAGTTLKYLHTDSWEVEAINWTPSLREEFRQRRGYDLLNYLPVIAGRIVDSRIESNLFLHDFRKTLGDLAIDNHYRVFRDRAHKRGLLFHPESGGPHAVPIDAQRCLGWNDAPMSEFWAWSWRHRIGDGNRFFTKQPASAAHAYGKRLVLAEGFTTIGPHWQETIWDNLKPSFDKALCEGMNLLVWHAVVCSPPEMGVPGQQYFAGTHFNPNTTWWSRSGAFLSYINRSQFLLQQGLFVADACYYYGDHVPNFSQLKRSDPARILPGYDYDVVTEEVILTRMSVQDGRLVLPDGMSYGVLVLPEREIISLPVLRKLKTLVLGGATIIGRRPDGASSLRDYQQAQAEMNMLAREMWGETNSMSAVRKVGKGRVISGKTAREVLHDDGCGPDFEFVGCDAGADLDYVHRRTEQANIYFVANRSNRWEEVLCRFCVSGKRPELWDAVTGDQRFAEAYRTDGRFTEIPLEFSPCGSWFVVFREPAAKSSAPGSSNSRRFKPFLTLEGGWTVNFDPKWGGPASVEFGQLVSWTARTEPGIKYYSGTATYRKSFDLPSNLATVGRKTWLDLGNVRELAEVRLNGHSLGIVWAPPFRVDVSKVLRPGGNDLQIDVVNFWPNRIIGDQFLAPEQRLTQTNIRKLTRDTGLMESGLFGPVCLQEQQ